MIAYAACIGDREKYTSICLPGLLRVTTDEDLTAVRMAYVERTLGDHSV